MIVVNGDAIWFVFQIISVFIMNIKVFFKYAFQTIMVYNVFQLSFKLKGSIRKLFSIIWDTECCLLVSSQHLVKIRKSLLS